MDFVLVLAIIVFIAIAIIVSLIYIIIRLHNKGRRITAKITAASLLLILLVTSYSIYSAVYPDESFYKEEFETALNQPFPANAHILNKAASYPDQHGDYASCFAIELDNKDYLALKEEFTGNSTRDSIAGSAPYNKIMSAYSIANVIAVHEHETEKGAIINILYFNDNKTILFYRASF